MKELLLTVGTGFYHPLLTLPIGGDRTVAFHFRLVCHDSYWRKPLVVLPQGAGASSVCSTTGAGLATGALSVTVCSTRPDLTSSLTFAMIAII
jgi:hypothetical protein